MSSPPESSLLDVSPAVDVVVVSYNSGPKLRECVGGLIDAVGIRIIVVDNASPDDSLSVLSGWPVETVQRHTNGGFAVGTNAGWRSGTAPYVLLLNPDATIDETSLRRLVDRLVNDPCIGAAAPLICEEDGTIDLSLRRFPRLRATYAQALFVHRLLPRLSWADDVVRDPAAYEQEGAPDWVSGACILVRRAALEQLGGLDERFFLYREDVDLCRRLRAAGWKLLFDPAATCVHQGGGGNSGDRSALLAVLARSRVLYARKYYSRPGAALERGGIVLGALTHSLLSRGGWRRRRGHLNAARAALRPISDGE